jgi:hypothetical protein
LEERALNLFDLLLNEYVIGSGWHPIINITSLVNFSSICQVMVKEVWESGVGTIKSRVKGMIGGAVRRKERGSRTADVFLY